MDTSLKSGTESYKVTFKKYGVSPEALKWISKESQQLRFNQFPKDINLSVKSLLDVGCGFADLVDYFSDKNSKYSYTGVDTVKEFIDVAKKLSKERLAKYPDIKLNFQVRDYVENPLKENFDAIYCSGALNTNVPNTVNFRKKAIETMWNHTNKILAFNMAGYYPQPKNDSSDRLYYANSLEILKYCFKFTSKIVFRQHYHPRDFTILMFR